MLYDDAEELEVRHVILLAHYNVDIFAGEDQVSEGDLFVKRSCIRLSRKKTDDGFMLNTRPYFLFSNNTSDKEDFYHALVRNLDSVDNVAMPLSFEPSHFVKLIQQMHESEENLQTRWFNALLGRIFLALYKTKTVENYVRLKISKKISRVRKPAFIDSIHLRAVYLGDAAPSFINPKLREMSPEGNVIIGSDVKYNGNFRLEIAATARIALGARFKARELNLVLVGTLKQLEGHILVRIKPPPTNRLWVAFETMPRMTLSVEPIVSARQITYGVILRAIENRIREVVKDTIVLPNWDDIPFLDSSSERFRGGIWDNPSRLSANGEDEIENFTRIEPKIQASKKHQSNSKETAPALSNGATEVADTNSRVEISKLSTSESDMSLFVEDLSDQDRDTKITTAADSDQSKSLQSDFSVVTTIPTIDNDASSHRTRLYSHRDDADTKGDIRPLPESLKANSLPASSRLSISSIDHAHAEGVLCDTPASNDKPIASDTSSAAPIDLSLLIKRDSKQIPQFVPSSYDMTASPPIPKSAPGPISTEDLEPPFQKLNSTTAVTKRWNWGALTRQSDQDHTPEDLSYADSGKSLREPLGRAQPLPPPSVPLRRSQRFSWSTSKWSLGASKRKPVRKNSASSTSLPERRSSQEPTDSTNRMPNPAGCFEGSGDELQNTTSTPVAGKKDDINLSNCVRDTADE